MKGVKLGIGTLLGGGIALLRHRPGAVLVWMLVYLVGIAGHALISRQMFRTDPIGATGGISYVLIGLLLSLLIPVLFTAAMRAMIRPRETEFASLDAGIDELRVIGLGLLFLIIWSLAAAFAAVITAPLTFALASGSGASTGVAVAAIIIALIQALIPCLVLASISLAFPLVLIRRRIVLDEAWRLSEGHVWPLFLTYLIIAVGAILLGFAIFAATDWNAFSVMIQGRDRELAALAELIRITGPIDAMTIVRWVLNAAQAVLGVVFMAGAIVTAARQLVPDEEELTQTFS